MSQPAIFLDKDGTLIHDVPFNVDPDRIVLTPGAERGLAMLHGAGYEIVVISNQSGVAHGRFPESALAGVHDRIAELLGRAGIPLAGFYYCPHHPEGAIARYARVCGCRKPAAGLFHLAARDLRLDLPASWMIGDILDDVEAGHRAGTRSVLLDRGGETEWLLSPLRTPECTAPDLADAAELILSCDRLRDRHHTTAPTDGYRALAPLRDATAASA